MYDDFTRLAPVDLSRADPDWPASKGPLLDTILAQRRGPRRWPAVVAAAFALAVGTVGILTVLNQAPDAVPVTPAEDRPAGSQKFTLPLTLIERGGETKACISTFQSLPPRCGNGFSVVGVQWELIPWAESTAEVRWAEAILVGSFDGRQMQVEQVFAADDDSAPRAAALPPLDHAPLCPEPVQGKGTGDPDSLHEAAQALPGYQGWWVSENQRTYNIAVSRAVDQASAKLRDVFAGEFCVGTIAGPEAALAMQVLEAITDHAPEVTAGLLVSRDGLWLELSPLDEGDIDSLTALLPPDVLAHVRFTPVIRPLSASTEPIGTPTSAAAPDGEWEPYELSTHCGIWELGHDDDWYLRVGGILDGGNGNPPAGWGNPMANGEILVVADRLHYRDDAGHSEVFALREGATEPLRICS